MALASIIRKSASSFAPLASRALRGPRNYHSGTLAALSHSAFPAEEPSLSPFPQARRFSTVIRTVDPSLPKNHRFSTKSDESLIKVIDSEIQCAEETNDDEQVEEIPSGFPFEIEDKPGYQTITLKRKYEGEDITIEVSMPDLVTGESEDDGDGENDSEKGNQTSIPLVVNIAKGGCPFLEFGVTAYPDEIVIDSLSVKSPENSEDQIAYEGPDFQDLDENLQKAFHKYLEIRGVKPSTTNFLHEYMINKDSKEYLNWLKNLKKFVAA